MLILNSLSGITSFRTSFVLLLKGLQHLSRLHLKFFGFGQLTLSLNAGMFRWKTQGDFGSGHFPITVQVFYEEGLMGRIGLQTFVAHKGDSCFMLGRGWGRIRLVCGCNGWPLTRDKRLYKKLFHSSA